MASSFAGSPWTVTRSRSGHSARRSNRKVRPDAVIEVRVRQEDVERVGLEIVARPVERRAGVEHHAQLRQQHARRLATVVGVIAGGAEQNELHGGSRGTGRLPL